MAIIISGASGDLGRRLSQEVLKQVPPEDVILLTRNPAALRKQLPAGLQVREADFDRPETLASAMADGDILYLISTLSIGKRAEQHGRAVQAAKAAGVRHVVYTSSQGVDQPANPSIASREHRATEQLIRDSGLHYTFLRHAWYADVIPQIMLGPAVESGQLVASAGDGVVAPVSKDDCVRVGAAVLTAPERFVDSAFEITGPELLSFTDIARLASEMSGREVQYINVSHEEKLAIFDAMGIRREWEDGNMHESGHAWVSSEMISFEQAIKGLYFSCCTRHVELITGRAATPLRALMTTFREAFCPAE